MGMEVDAALELARVNLCLGYEARMLAKNAQQRKLPVTIVSGFLGAGKTSLLHHFLANRLNLRMACAVSDLASINMDQLLLTDKTIMSYRQQQQPTRESHVSIATNAMPLPPVSSSKPSTLPSIYGVTDRSVDAFKNVIWDVLQEQSGEEKPFDYLVIETSGTTDPTQLIAAVQERFGKMTRARIDSVVVVVDGDALASSASSSDPSNATGDSQTQLNPVAIAQLACADVVVLNKIDLMDENAKVVAHNLIQQYAPEARVYETQYGQVYLPHVLDIIPPEGLHDTLSHEKVEAHWVCNSDENVGSLRVGQYPTAYVVDKSSSGFDSFVYEEKKQPISLASLHQWLANKLPTGTLRVKGVVWIAEDPCTRFVVQVSGKKRLEIEHAGPWISKPETQLVAIGMGFSNQEEFQLDFQLVHFPEKNDSEISKSISNECIQRIQEDIRFEIVQVFDSVIQFRLSLLTQSRTLDETQLRHYHQVDRNEMLRRLIHEVNAVGGGALLLPVITKVDRKEQEEQQEEWMMTAMVSRTGDATVLSMWETLSERTNVILNEIQMKMSSCRCGF